MRTMRAFALFPAVFIVVTVLAGVPAQASENDAGSDTWRIYHNPRYNYSIKYPAALLRPLGEAENGDGQVFAMPGGGAELIVYAGHNALDTKLREAFEDVVNEPGREVTYKKLDWDWFVVSGYEGGRVFYRKTILKNKTFYSFMLLYDEGLKGHFDPLVEEIARSFTLP